MWAQLRKNGIRTPEVSAWQRVPYEYQKFSQTNRAKAIYPYLLNVYNVPEYQQVSACSPAPAQSLQAPLCCSCQCIMFTPHAMELAACNEARSDALRLQTMKLCLPDLGTLLP